MIDDPSPPETPPEPLIDAPHLRAEMARIRQLMEDVLRSVVFEANDANTWHKVTVAMTGILTELWHEQDLKGKTASEAFSVTVQPGPVQGPPDPETGYISMIVKVAPVHPAEFIVLTVEQLMVRSG